MNLKAWKKKQSKWTEQLDKTNKETAELINVTDQMDLIDFYKIFHPADTEYTFFS